MLDFVIAGFYTFTSDHNVCFFISLSAALSSHTYHPIHIIPYSIFAPLHFAWHNTFCTLHLRCQLSAYNIGSKAKSVKLTNHFCVFSIRVMRADRNTHTEEWMVSLRFYSLLIFAHVQYASRVQKRRRSRWPA